MSVSYSFSFSFFFTKCPYPNRGACIKACGEPFAARGKHRHHQYCRAWSQGGYMRGIVAACGECEGEGIKVGPLVFNQLCLLFFIFLENGLDETTLVFLGKSSAYEKN
ncbi:hypothetical protein Hanom_Chr08g00732191 [Helianthus anomalus]